MKRAPLALRGHESLAPEHEGEDFEPVRPARLVEREQAAVMARHAEDGGEVDLEELLGDRAGALPVEPPATALGENAPAQLAAGDVVDPPQVAKHLRRGRGLLPPGTRLPVERPAPAFRLDDGEAQLIAFPLVVKAIRVRLDHGALEKQAVRHVVAAA